MEENYVPPIYRIIWFLDEIRRDIQEARFVSRERKRREKLRRKQY